MRRVIVAFHEVACMTGLHFACVVGDMLDTPGQPPLFSDFTVDAPTLDDVFLNLTSTTPDKNEERAA